MQRGTVCHLILVVVLIVLSACGESAYAVGATPQAAVEQHIQRQDPAGDAMVPFRTYQLDQYAIVLYGKPGIAPNQQLFYQFAYPSREGWYTKECCDLGGGSLTPIQGLDNLIHIAFSDFPEPRFVYGFAMQPNVAAVEATFDNGETVRSVLQDGFFFVVSQTARNVCELRVLDENLRELGQTHPTSSPDC